tara:strand:- start:3459 stop:4403 length:945 start_codon:yes stop_codon:yes gene_type:complete
VSIKKSYRVLSIKKELCKEWLLYKHYAKRVPSISFSFGLFKNEILVGVITFGMPPSSTLASSICGEKYKDIVLELNRLVVNDGLDKNALSYFVSNSINQLPKPNIIVSFSDNNMNHNGYIYQATNFIFTGQTSNDSMYIDKDGKEFHFRNLGHYQKNNRLNVSLIKRRLNEDKIDKIKIAKYLRKNKGEWTAKKLDKIFGYKDTAAHWFRIDNGFSFANIDDWKRLKETLNLDNKYDNIMLDFEWVADVKEIIKKLELKKVKILPKNRYVFISANKKDKKKILFNMKLIPLPYPKGINKRYDAGYNPLIQTQIF